MAYFLFCLFVMFITTKKKSLFYFVQELDNLTRRKTEINELTQDPLVSRDTSPTVLLWSSLYKHYEYYFLEVIHPAPHRSRELITCYFTLQDVRHHTYVYIFTYYYVSYFQPTHILLLCLFYKIKFWNCSTIVLRFI